MRNIETKSSLSSGTDGQEISHNNFIIRSNTLLATTQGITDGTANVANRIGDEIMLSGVSIKMMLELNERYSQATFRILVVKSAKGDSPNNTTLWNGRSNNKMIDTLNTERYTILVSKTFTITSDGSGKLASGLQTIGGGFEVGTDTHSRATRIVKMYIPGTKFSKSRKIMYENGTSQVKFFDYHLLVYAYSNYSTSDTLNFNVGRVNDEVIQLFYKDA